MKIFGSLILLSLLASGCFLLRSGAPADLESPQLEVGVNVQAGGDLDLTRFCEIGGTWARLDLYWPDLEPQRGQWNFAAVDRTLDIILSGELKVYATLSGTPAWASPGGRVTGVPDAGAWKHFVETVAARYGSRVSVFGVWNEPNLDDFWDGSVEDYVQVLLKPAYAAISAKAPRVRVAGPELAHIYSARLGIQDFLAQFKKLGGDRYIHIFSHHAYGAADFQSKITGFRRGQVIYRNGLVQMMQKTGLWGRKVWITETGQDAADGGEERQARVVLAQLRFLATQTWVRKAFIYKLKDSSGDGEHYGLLRADSTARPVFSRVGKWLKDLKAQDK